MPLRDAETLARAAVPGSGEPRLSLLGSGLINDTYRVERDGRTYSMRVAVETSRDLEPNRAWELKVLYEASERGLAPPLVNGDTEGGFLVQEWVAGRSWPAPYVHQPSIIARMAELLKRVHELPQPTAARSMSAGAWIDHYSAALAAANLAVAEPLAQAAVARLASLEDLPTYPGVICHSDLHLMNLLECPRRASRSTSLMLLDWEYAHVSEPFWDLAGWSANNDFPERLVRALLTAYLGRVPQEAEWLRCKLLVWLYDYVCLLWSGLYTNLHQGGAADGIAKRAEVLSKRLAVKRPGRV